MLPPLTAFIVTIAVAAVVGMIMKALHQPLIVAYIMAGIIVGPLGFSLIQHGEVFDVFSTLGVSSLLFLVGLGLHPQYIRDVGPSALAVGLGQLFFTALTTWFLAIVLGYSLTASLYLAMAFTFSSTIIVLRLLQEKEEADSLFGRISIGVLLVQDVVAMGLFLLISSASKSQSLSWFLLVMIGKLVLLAAAAYLFVRFILPRIEALIADNRELLLLSSLAFCLACALGFATIGFSYELGALTAGVILSWSRVFREIATRIQPMRDFFLVLFFAIVGADLTLSGISDLWLPVLVFSAFVLVGKPFIVYFIMVFMGYTRKTSFLTGLTMAQISEFSLILIALAMKVGHLSSDVLTLAIMVGLITIAASSYLITYSEAIYGRLERLLLVVTPKAAKREPVASQEVHPVSVLVFGAHRLGGGILEQVQKEGMSYLVVDFDPHLIAGLQAKHVPARFGSADDPVFLDSLDFSELKLVVSTIPDHTTNSFLIGYIRRRLPVANIICVSNHASLARELYDLGADYVVMPPYLGRRFVVDLFKKNLFAHNKYKQEKTRHLRDLQYLLD